ncbi:hypothetical protein OZD70_05055 [Wolbachia endosymbiont of Drosophila tsacasi]|nr:MULTISPECIES: hypothetical protein [Wolbachia]MDE5060920.1 hypothetical protein [Wolbachia endosymbiont of Drosophila nikananu]MDE5062467.1 hypothetical protein [Wolbachia endosymbiont of Drosophila tsacasi]MDE5062600.1 hypothetical protein [Wolbachia endosymbiont of Drosophila tsacasi]
MPRHWDPGNLTLNK